MPVRFQEHYRKADRIMLALIWLMCLFSLERILLRLAGEPVDDVAADPTITEA